MAAAARVKTTGSAGPQIVPPGPPPRAGDWLSTLRFYRGFALDPIGFVRARFESYGDVYFVPESPGLYVLRHPDHIRDVLVTHAASMSKAHSAFQRLSRFLGNGLLNSDGDTWKRQRRMVAPAFMPARLAGYASVMSEEGARTAASWRDGETRDMSLEMMELTLRVVGRTLFGEDVGGDVSAVSHAMSAFQANATRPIELPRWMPSPQRRRTERGLASIDAIIARMVRRRREGGGTPNARPDLLQMLVTAVDEEGDGGTLSEREVRDQLVTLFLAGHETTSHALTWSLYLLSQHPASAAKVRAELDDVLSGRAATYEDLPRLQYTERVLEEAMRLYPPAYTVARKVIADVEIGGFHMPAGSEVMVWIYMTHHDARWFPEPESFRPERFEPAEAAKLPRFAYLPFGAGPRACIGKSFAMLEAKLLLATLLSRCDLSLARDQRVAPQPKITLVPKHGMRMVVSRRRDGLGR